MSNPTGILLINLGTPQSPQISDVRAYLDEFLMDAYVIDSPWWLRRLLVSAFILPFRPRQSAANYARIWRPDGSPLLIESTRLAEAVAARVPCPVALAMRYGQPSIDTALTQLREKGVERLVVMPLYPHYADSTVTTSVEAVKRQWRDTEPTVVPPFYDHPGYVAALAASIRTHLTAPWDHLLLSYHGLPERHLTRADPTGNHCLSSAACCDEPSNAHATCYRHQVYATSKAVARALTLDPDTYSVSFQSRLGRLPWLQPYTDQRLVELAEQGVRRLVVACPAFVADNLETLEEIGIQGRETFRQAGGESLTLVPCLNADPAWVEVLVNLLKPYNLGAMADSSL